MIQRPHISTLFPYTTLFRSDEILKLIDREMPFRMRPTKGEYYILSSKAKGFVNKVIYPLPTKMGKGILLVPQTNGEIMVGPSSYEVTDKVSLANTKKNLRIVKREAKKIARSEERRVGKEC